MDAIDWLATQNSQATVIMTYCEYPSDNLTFIPLAEEPLHGINISKLVCMQVTIRQPGKAMDSRSFILQKDV